jgi:hypothetical protein
MRIVLVIYFIAACALVGCRQAPQTHQFDLSAVGERIAQVICPGPPTGVEPVENQHISGQVDRLETRECSDGSSTIYVGRTTSDPSGLEVAASVRTHRSELPSHLQIGQSAKRAIAILGQPASVSRDSATYELGEEGLDTATIHFTDDRITSIEWSWSLE